jgi:hypothetical protein
MLITRAPHFVQGAQKFFLPPSHTYARTRYPEICTRCRASSLQLHLPKLVHALAIDF